MAGTPGALPRTSSSTNSLTDDVTVTRRVIAAQNGPVVLVGHSYGGVVITEAGEALNGAVTTPASKAKPSWYLVATDDRMIPPPAQRFMAKRAGATVTEIAGSHSVYVSQPAAVAGLIAKASRGPRCSPRSTSWPSASEEGRCGTGRGPSAREDPAELAGAT